MCFYFFYRCMFYCVTKNDFWDNYRKCYSSKLTTRIRIGNCCSAYINFWYSSNKASHQKRGIFMGYISIWDDWNTSDSCTLIPSYTWWWRLINNFLGNVVFCSIFNSNRKLYKLLVSKSLPNLQCRKNSCFNVHLTNL